MYVRLDDVEGVAVDTCEQDMECDLELVVENGQVRVKVPVLVFVALEEDDEVVAE